MDAAQLTGYGREQRAWYWYDWANSAYYTTTSTVLFGPYLTSVAKRDACPDQDIDLVCKTNLSVLGIPISPGSLALYTVTAATLLAALVLPLIGAMIDRTGRKRTIMAALAWVGALAAASMVFVAGSNWQLGVVLQMIATLCAAASLVAYDAILVDIATPDERDRVSSRGWAMGYAGGGLLLLVNLVMLSGVGGLATETAVRISLLGAGLWWGLFTLIPFIGLRRLDHLVPAEPAPGGPGPPSEDGGAMDGGVRPQGAMAVSEPASSRVSVGLIGQSFGQLRDTLTHLRGYPHTLLFLLAYLFYNDGIQTVINASSIFGQEQLGFSADQLVLTILVVQFVAIGGALAFGAIAARIGAWRAIQGGLVLWCLVVTLGYFLPAGRLALFLSLAVLIGLVLGGTQALSRSLFSQLIPRGREAEYFSLYQAAERGTSWFGTLLFGLVFQITDSYRYAIIALAVFFVIGGLLLVRVDVRRGITQAGNDLPSVV